jgi:error-prone DNA polymerase
MYRLFRDIPQALQKTVQITEIASQFSLDSLCYTYPEEICPAHTTPLSHLTAVVYEGANLRYPSGVPDHVEASLQEELSLIHELQYEKYFLTCYDIVQFARSRGILCQGRGAAANSSVCYCLGITSVDPTQINLLFARFVSKERQEPPDIDIDFEHERREEVIQYIYGKYGRERAAIAAEVVTFRARSAVREVGKALGLSLEAVDALAKEVHRWTDYTITPEILQNLGLSPTDSTVRNTLLLTQELIGFPRHLSQHVGGFIISHELLCEIVPIINTGMESRTMIEWDKNDIEELGMLKIDILALGMLTCIRKALDLINARQDRKLELYSIPPNDSAVYDMLCASDTLGVFQVESRAQMSMLPRLKPRCFYDIVIEVAIVRPGPIQGNMVHPYLRRRNGLEKVSYPDARVENILGKTLGVPIFQ